MDYLPVFYATALAVRARVVVAAGRVALRKVDLLRRSGARITVVAPELREELHKLAVSGAIQHIRREVRGQHLDREAAVLVIAATDITRSTSPFPRPPVRGASP